MIDKAEVSAFFVGVVTVGPGPWRRCMDLRLEAVPEGEADGGDLDVRWPVSDDKAASFSVLASGRSAGNFSLYTTRHNDAVLSLLYKLFDFVQWWQGDGLMVV